MRSSLYFALLLVLAVALVAYVDARVPGIGRVYYAGGSFDTAVDDVGVAVASTKNLVKIGNDKIGTEGQGVFASVGNTDMDGNILAMHYDICSNLWIAGTFTTVGGVRTGPVAVKRKGSIAFEAVNADAGADGAWSPSAQVNAIDVDCINLKKDPRKYCDVNQCDLYIGGKFSRAAGKVSDNLAWFEASTDAPAWFALSRPGNHVSSLKYNFITKTIVVGGDLTDGYLQWADKKEQKWSKLEGVNAPNGDVRAMYMQYGTRPATFTDKIYFGGDFNKPYEHVALLNLKSIDSTGTVEKVADSQNLNVTTVTDMEVSVQAKISTEPIDTNLYIAAPNQGIFRASLKASAPKWGMKLAGNFYSVSVCSAEEANCKNGDFIAGGVNELKAFIATSEESFTVNQGVRSNNTTPVVYAIATAVSDGFSVARGTSALLVVLSALATLLMAF